MNLPGYIVLLSLIASSLSAGSYEQLVAQKLIRKGKPTRLHLGCGQQRFKGYINIDYPSSEHTVQQKVVADYCSDITGLSFPMNVVDEVRSHHFFEHFDRQRSLALLVRWTQWLKTGGKMHIETPDMQKSIELLIKPNYTFKQKQYILRHIFGSHEAHWAYHYDGWYGEKFTKVLEKMGYTNIAVSHSQYLLLANVTVMAKKTIEMSEKQLVEAAKDILRWSMVDSSASEERKWRVWCDDFDAALAKMPLS